MARKTKDTRETKEPTVDQSDAVELDEDQLDDAQGGLSLGSKTLKIDNLTQKVNKIRDLGTLSNKTFKI
ncbi:MAG: hypothetical protein RIM84_03920 [Alphaproteobacteria bacterium]